MGYNVPENAIRPTALGKKNWLFIGEAEAGQRSAILYTIVECCRRRGIDPFAYLRDKPRRTTTRHRKCRRPLIYDIYDSRRLIRNRLSKGAMRDAYKPRSFPSVYFLLAPCVLWLACEFIFYVRFLGEELIARSTPYPTVHYLLT